MYNTESRPLSGEEKLIEKSVDFRSNSDTRIVVSQRYHPNIVECKSLLTSINKHENASVEKAETGQTEKYKNDRTVSNINETTQNNSKVKFLSFLLLLFFFYILGDYKSILKFEYS